MSIISNFVTSVSLASAITFSMPEHAPNAEPFPAEAAQSITVAAETGSEASAPYDQFYGVAPIILSQMTPQERLGLRLGQAFGLNETRAKNYAGWVLEALHTYSIPPVVMFSVISAESDFRYQAASWFGAVGPAQVVPRFWAHQCDGDIVNDPRANIMCAAKILDRYFTRCEGSVSCTLGAYNTGPHYINNPSPEMDAAMAVYWDKIASRMRKYDPTLRPNFHHSWRETTMIADSR